MIRRLLAALAERRSLRRIRARVRAGILDDEAAREYVRTHCDRCGDPVDPESFDAYVTGTSPVRPLCYGCFLVLS